MLRVVNNLRILTSWKPPHSSPLTCYRKNISTHSPQNAEIRPPVTLEEPRGDGRSPLYYHLLPASSSRPTNSSSSEYKWALSLLPHPPSTSATDDISILGVLPAQVADLSNTGNENWAMNIDNFEQNPRFVETLQQAVQTVLDQDADELLRAEARARGEGWMHICGTYLHFLVL
jgi:hypothetical protein